MADVILLIVSRLAVGYHWQLVPEEHCVLGSWWVRFQSANIGLATISAVVNVKFLQLI